MRVQLAKKIRFLVDTNLNTGSKQVQAFKKIMKAAIYPEDERGYINFDLAITTFEAAKIVCGDQESFIDLALFLSECGTQFLVDLDDIDEDFLVTMEDIFEEAVKMMKNSDTKLFEKYKKRLYDIHEFSEDTGYGHGDQIQDILDMYFPGFLELHS